MSAFNQLLARHIGASFVRQFALADLIGNQAWSADLESGQVTFGRDLSFPIQLLGTESQGDNTWLWSWANADSQLPDRLLVAAQRLRAIGQEKDIPEFVDRGFPLERADGHALSLIASSLIGNCCYYRGPYEGGALFFLVNNVPPALFEPAPAERVLTVLTKVISEYALEHRTMAENLLQSQGFAWQPGGDTLTAVRGGDSIDLSFDALGRISKIGGTIQPRPPPKRWWEFWKA
jgi:hypothetical protein